MQRLTPPVFRPFARWCIGGADWGYPGIVGSRGGWFGECRGMFRLLADGDTDAPEFLRRTAA